MIRIVKDPIVKAVIDLSALFNSFLRQSKELMMKAMLALRSLTLSKIV